MREKLKRINKQDNNGKYFLQAFEKGWSFSGEHLADKDGKIMIYK